MHLYAAMRHVYTYTVSSGAVGGQMSSCCDLRNRAPSSSDWLTPSAASGRLEGGALVRYFSRGYIGGQSTGSTKRDGGENAKEETTKESEEGKERKHIYPLSDAVRSSPSLSYSRWHSRRSVRSIAGQSSGASGESAKENERERGRAVMATGAESSLTIYRGTSLGVALADSLAELVQVHTHAQAYTQAHTGTHRHTHRHTHRRTRPWNREAREERQEKRNGRTLRCLLDRG